MMEEDCIREQCISCHFCRPVAFNGHVKEMFLECRINPPLVFPSNQLRAAWPIVPMNGWCSKFINDKEQLT